MRHRFWDKRIPTFLGIFFLAISIGVTTFLVKQGGLFSVRAIPSHDPKDVRVTNISDSSFTVSYFTKDPTSGVINYGESPSLGKSGLDDKDQELGNVSNHLLHNITVKNLAPKTKYYFSIISGKDTYTNNSNPFEITTGEKIVASFSDQTPMKGSVTLPNREPPKEAIVYLTANNAQVISTVLKPDGSFLLPLNSLRNSNLNSYFIIENDTVLKLLIIGDNLTSNIVLSTLQINPVPTITLSNDYDFTLTTDPKTPSLTNNATFPSFGSGNINETKKPQILTPQKDQNFTDTQPQFKGTALPDKEVQIIIHSDENINTEVKTDSNGNWVYRPQAPLSAGQHTITIITKDASGIVKTLTQSFVVYASGTQIEGAAGSPTPTPKPKSTSTPTPTRIPTPTSKPTSTPTLSPTAVPTATLIAKASLTPTNTPTVTDSGQSPTPTPPLPPTGNPTIITAGIVGLLLSFIGGLLFLLTRGGIKL